jgi:hypothetical protein
MREFLFSFVSLVILTFRHFDHELRLLKAADAGSNRGEEASELHSKSTASIFADE